jgi:YD repeat-containing protein
MVYPIRAMDADGKESITIYNLIGGNNRDGEVYAYSDRNGNSTYYLRDDNGNITKQINPDMSYKEYTYDSKNNVLSERDETGKYTFYVYDANSINLVKTAQPLNGTDVYSDIAVQADFAITNYTYYSNYGEHSINGLTHTVTDPEGNVITYAYDSYGYVSTITSPEAETTTYEYNLIGWLKYMTTPKGFTTNYYYDKNGNMLKQANPDGGVIRNSYNFRGDLTQTVQPEQYSVEADTWVAFDSSHIQNSIYSLYTATQHGYRYAYYYANGLLQTATDPLNNATTYTYDIYGNTLTETTPDNAVYGCTYDDINRIETATFKETPSSTAELLQEYEYNILTNGNTTVTVTQYFDSTNTAVTTTTYDWAGRQIRQDQADGNYTTKEYNANGTLASATDARGNTTYYTYDGLNRLTTTRKPLQGRLFYLLVDNTYDKAGNVTKVTRCDVLVPPIMTMYTYDGDGNVTQQLTSGGAKTTYTYDDDGNLQDKYIYYNSTTASRENYTYNNMGQLTSKHIYTQNRDIIGYDDSSTELILTSSYTYDLNGNVLTSVDENGVTTTYTYDLMNRLLTTSQPGLDESGTPVTISTSQTYDWAGNILTATDPRNNTTTYDYDNQGNLITVTDALNGVSFFAYDRAGRKTAEVSPNNYVASTPISSLSRFEYDYDDMGRVVLVTQVYYDSLTSTWKQFVSAAYTYDGNGNVTYEQDALGYQNGYGTSYEYNDANLITKMTDPECQLASMDYTMLYSYDFCGRLATTTDANGVVTDYMYDSDDNLLAIRVDNVFRQTNTYDLKGNLLTSTDGNGNTTTYTYNDLNGVRSVTLPGDASIAGITTTYKYTKLGQVAQSLDSLGKQQLITYDNQGNVLTTTEQKKRQHRGHHRDEQL